MDNLVRSLHLVIPQPESGQNQGSPAGHGHPRPEHRQQKDVTEQTENPQYTADHGIAGAQLNAAQDIQHGDQQWSRHGRLFRGDRPEDDIQGNDESDNGEDKRDIAPQNADPQSAAKGHPGAQPHAGADRQDPDGQYMLRKTGGEGKSGQIDQPPENQLAGLGPVILKTGGSVLDGVDLAQGLRSLFGGGQHDNSLFLIRCKALYYVEQTNATAVSEKVSFPSRLSWPFSGQLSSARHRVRWGS